MSPFDHEDAREHCSADTGGWGTLVVVGVSMVVLLVVAGRLLHARALFREALAWISGLGLAGVAVFIGLYVLACILFIPGSILTLGAGAVYGVVRGSLIVSLASTLGATCAFLVGRHLARDRIASKIGADRRFAAIDKAVAREGAKIVGLTRLSPVFPFNLLNYAFGLTGVSVRHYVLASWLGMAPGTILYVYVGSLAGNLAAAGSGERARSPAEWALYGVGLAATVGVSVVVARIARKALAEHIPGN